LRRGRKLIAIFALLPSSAVYSDNNRWLGWQMNSLPQLLSCANGKRTFNNNQRIGKSGC
jgi:hypothetical protein